MYVYVLLSGWRRVAYFKDWDFVRIKCVWQENSERGKERTLTAFLMRILAHWWIPRGLTLPTIWHGSGLLLKNTNSVFFINFKAVTLLSFWLHRILSLSVACEPPIVPWSVTSGWKLSKLSHNHQIPRKWVGQTRRESKPKTPDTNYDQTIKYCFPTKLIDWSNTKCESYGNCVCVS